MRVLVRFLQAEQAECLTGLDPEAVHDRKARKW